MQAGLDIDDGTLGILAAIGASLAKGELWTEEGCLSGCSTLKEKQIFNFGVLESL